MKRPHSMIETPPSVKVALGLNSYYEVLPNTIQCDAPEFELLQKFMTNDVKSTPNPRNPRTFLKRKQCTFVTEHASEYEFGQYNQTFRSSSEEWPQLIREALRLTKHYAEQFNADPSWYNGVHVNLYSDGSVGVNPHFDKEASLVEGAPIFSFTLLSDASLPRLFSIYTLQNEKLHDVPLHHGSMMVMYGSMQTHFKHGLEAAKPPSKYKHLARINLTVRAFKNM